METTGGLVVRSIVPGGHLGFVSAVPRVAVVVDETALVLDVEVVGATPPDVVGPVDVPNASGSPFDVVTVDGGPVVVPIAVGSVVEAVALEDESVNVVIADVALEIPVVEIASVVKVSLVEVASVVKVSPVEVAPVVKISLVEVASVVDAPMVAPFETVVCPEVTTGNVAPLDDESESIEIEELDDVDSDVVLDEDPGGKSPRNSTGCVVRSGT